MNRITGAEPDFADLYSVAAWSQYPSATLVDSIEDEGPQQAITAWTRATRNVFTLYCDDDLHLSAYRSPHVTAFIQDTYLTRILTRLDGHGTRDVFSLCTLSPSLPNTAFTSVSIPVVGALDSLFSPIRRIAYASEAPGFVVWLREVVEKIGLFGELYGNDNWDGYGAIAITSDTVLAAIRIANSVPRGFGEPDIAPSAEGGIAFEWTSEGGTWKKLFLDAENDGTWSLYWRLENGENGSASGISTDLNELRDILVKLSSEGS